VEDSFLMILNCCELSNSGAVNATQFYRTGLHSFPEKWES